MLRKAIRDLDELSVELLAREQRLAALTGQISEIGRESTSPLVSGALARIVEGGASCADASGQIGGAAELLKTYLAGRGV
jgi:hypothetical protein